MAKNQHFDIGFTITQGMDEHIFISVSPGFEHGPGIQRDGITKPRMTDPHTVPGVTNILLTLNKMSPLPDIKLEATTNAFVQRAGTWTLYHHVKDFIDNYGSDWRIIGVQSNGDLTMNYWHVALINNKQGKGLCGLFTQSNPQEPITERTYRCLVKWTSQAIQVRKCNYEFLNLRFEPFPNKKWGVKLAEKEQAKYFDEMFKHLEEYNSSIHDISSLLEFALSGKIIVESGKEISLANAIDRFEDVRHVFNLPQVAANGHYGGNNISDINFGEYQLFQSINERRAALSSPVLITTMIETNVTSNWENIRDSLKKRHYFEVNESPTRRGQFRFYSNKAIEIFFPHNVYPFGVLGIRPSETNPDEVQELVGLSSGGLSGRVGNTLEGISQIMFDFLGCTDAMVLDEGNDVFSLTNPQLNKQGYKYTNAEFLSRVLSFSKFRVDIDADEALKEANSYPLGNNMKTWPLNEIYINEIEEEFSKTGAVEYSDIITVAPNRSQMRSVLIFAVKETN